MFDSLAQEWERLRCRFILERFLKLRCGLSDDPQKQLPLFVLPPKSPKLNGHVERSHRTHHEEFYQVHADSDKPPRLNYQLRHWKHTYNCVRPHQSLAYLIPLEFVTRWKNNQRKAKCH
jgi:transposase InsO family protein